MSKSTSGSGKPHNGPVVHPRHRPWSGAVAPPSLESLKYLHSTLQDRLVPEAQRQSRDFEDLTENVLRKLKVELARAESSASASSNALLGSKKRRRAPFHPQQLPAKARELLRRWFVCFIHLNDCLLHARTGILRHSYQHAAATLATQDANRPKGLARYCDLDDRLCNYKHTSASYAEVCWDNATSLARLLQGPGEGGAQAAALGKKGRAALEGLESSLSMLDGSLQQLSTKAALLLDRVKAALPGPMQMDRSPGSESLEVLLPHRPCVNVDHCTCPPQGPPHATATPEQENEAWSSGKLYDLGYDQALSDIEDDTPAPQSVEADKEEEEEEEGQAMDVDTPPEVEEKGKEETKPCVKGAAVCGSGEEVVVLVSYQQQVVRVGIGAGGGVVGATELLWAIALQIVRDRDAAAMHSHSGEGVEWPWLLHVREQGPTSTSAPTSTSTSTPGTEGMTYPPGSILDLKGLARRQQRSPSSGGGTSGAQGSGHVVRLMLAWDNKRTIRPLPRAALHYIRQCDQAGVAPLRSLTLALLLPSSPSPPLVKHMAAAPPSCPSPTGPFLSALCDLATEHQAASKSTTTDSTAEAPSLPSSTALVEVEPVVEAVVEPAVALPPCPLLSTLDLSLVQLPPSGPTPLPSTLRSLNLASTGLRSLAPLLSQPLPHLTQLDISHNPLLVLQPLPFPTLLPALPQLQSLCVEGLWVSVPDLCALLPSPKPRPTPDSLTQLQHDALHALAQALAQQQEQQQQQQQQQQAAASQQGPDASCGVRALSLSLNTLPSPHCWPLVLSRLPPSLTTLSLHHISPPPPPLPTPLLQTLTRLDLCPLPSHRTDSEGRAVLSPCLLHLLQSPVCYALTHLDLSCLRPRLAPPAATQLFTSLCVATCLPHLEHLCLSSSLDLSLPSTAEAPLRTLGQALAQNGHLCRLEQLSLRACRLQLESLCVLLSCVSGALRCPLLRLDLSDNHPTPVGPPMGPSGAIQGTLMQLGLGLRAFLTGPRGGRRVDVSGNGLASSLHVLLPQGEGEAGVDRIRVEGNEREGLDRLVLGHTPSTAGQAEGQH